MEKFNWQKIKPYAVEGLLFLVVIGLVWFGVFYLRGNIQKKMDRLQELDVLSENRYRQMARLPELEDQFSFIEKKQETLSSVLLTKERLVEFIQTLEGLAADNHVEIKISSQDNTLLESKITVLQDPKNGIVADSDTPSSPQGSAGTKKKIEGILADLPFENYIRLTITVTGTYPQVIGFLHAMETLPYELDVIGIRMSEHVEDNRIPTPDAGINPFNPDGTLAPVVITPPKILHLDANYDTVIYLQK